MQKSLDFGTESIFVTLHYKTVAYLINSTNYAVIVS